MIRYCGGYGSVETPAMSPADRHHLRAAEGWLELGDWHESNEELERITPSMRAHPDVLRMRVEIYSAAKRWEYAAEVASTLSRIAPDEAFGHVRLAFALHELKRPARRWKRSCPSRTSFLIFG